MKFTHEELANAVRRAGHDGQTFDSAAVRRCLGLETRDRSELTRFQNQFRAWLKAAPETVEKLATNSYRLQPLAAPATATPLAAADAVASVASASAPALVAPAPNAPHAELNAPHAERPRFEPRAVSMLFGEHQLPALRAWLDRGQRLGRRVAGFFARP